MGSDPGVRLDELVALYGLPAAARSSLVRLLEVVASDDAAPTTVREPAEAVDVHIADSLAGLELSVVREARAIADLGAGAGFPGLVLATALPEARVCLVESVGKKCAFMARTAEHAGIGNVEVVNARAEEWPAGIGANDVVTARALAPLGVLVEYAAPLLRRRGSLVAWKGARSVDEGANAAAAAGEVGLEPVQVVPVRPWAGVAQRHLYVYSKVSETPTRFPRRPGMARKRPLGGSTRG